MKNTVDLDRMIICDKCRKSVSVRTVRYVPVSYDKLMVVCAACRGKNEVKVKDGKPVKPTEKNKDISKEDYFCSRCNYRFKFKPSLTAKLQCPYCGKGDKIKKTKETGTEHLIAKSDF
ncbi:MAG: hypothetical protein KKF46_05650 [Nanoarchaeota archaeon]|nr:hypothetical protein [Nanoarchaeota archaeon]MBU1321816.1 hypothetical protein [Nanoarchaeota archaeon]MBU1598263.1 hypothetical protein [Nanoarchaeota archaeon]MBU2441708.1 hypothetical protein [Nanoarchaeota archaeon]